MQNTNKQREGNKESRHWAKGIRRTNGTKERKGKKKEGITRKTWWYTPFTPFILASFVALPQSFVENTKDAQKRRWERREERNERQTDREANRQANRQTGRPTRLVVRAPFFPLFVLPSVCTIANHVSACDASRFVCIGGRGLFFSIAHSGDGGWREKTEKREGAIRCTNNVAPSNLHSTN